VALPFLHVITGKKNQIVYHYRHRELGEDFPRQGTDCKPDADLAALFSR
jgi:hypothetical protein